MHIQIIPAGIQTHNFSHYIDCSQCEMWGKLLVDMISFNFLYQENSD